jgi:glycine cleavage system regulatory protein
MQEALVLTLIGPDRSGIVDSLASIISEHGGSWERSHLAALAGQFAGLVQISCPTDRCQALRSALQQIDGGLSVTIREENQPEVAMGQPYQLDVLGNDRPGIVAEVTRALRSQNVNILEIETVIKPAPESGQNIFQTIAQISLPAESEPSSLESALEALSPDLQVSLAGKDSF